MFGRNVSGVIVACLAFAAGGAQSHAWLQTANRRFNIFWFTMGGYRVAWGWNHTPMGWERNRDDSDFSR